MKTYLGSVATIRISSNRKVLSCRTSVIPTFPALLFAQLQACQNQSTLVSVHPFVPLPSIFFPSPFPSIFPQPRAPSNMLFILTFPHPLSNFFFPLKRMCAGWETDFLSWVLSSSASLPRAGCCQLKRNFLLLIFPSAAPQVTRWLKHPLPEESRGEPLFYHLPR